MGKVLVGCLVLILSVVGPPCNAEIVQMKIVDEVSNYGWNAGPDLSRKLEPKVSPAAFSGPHHFRVLFNKCFEYLEENYKYEVCVFNNVTQHERTMRWNPYSGILGVWTEWEISNNTFTAMVMKNGDDCGSDNRQVKVTFSCGKKNNVTSVSEPSRCHYHVAFDTPLACHEDSMLVYPVLNATLRSEWDDIEQDYHDQLTTEKGYKAKLANLFYKAGLQTEPTALNSLDSFSDFTSLETCNSKYLELLKEVESLKKQLQKS